MAGPLTVRNGRYETVTVHNGRYFKPRVKIVTDDQNPIQKLFNLIQYMERPKCWNLMMVETVFLTNLSHICEKIAQNLKHGVQTYKPGMHFLTVQNAPN